jgi:N-acetyl sugar amidotransferase
MDTSDPDIIFDEKGECNHCKQHDIFVRDHVPVGEKATVELNKLVDRIKSQGRGKKYDCIIGLSGGVDSTYVALLVKKLGLRPLAVHLDNGWNSELAVKNVENIVNKLGFDLYTIVINWEEFKALQLAYLRSGVVDLEATSDHAIVATMYKLCKEHDLHFVIGGTNFATESILPQKWYFQRKDDLVNLKDIYKKYGSGIKLRTFPTLGFPKLVYYNLFHRVEWISILNYVPYVKDEVKEIIKKELDWNDYGGKHHESIITKFYQSYILPQKFGYDKRRAHLSSLICSKQISRDQALYELSLPVYKCNFDLENDIEYIIKKFGISRSEFDLILSGEKRQHDEFKTDIWQRILFYKSIDILKSFKDFIHKK